MLKEGYNSGTQKLDLTKMSTYHRDHVWQFSFKWLENSVRSLRHNISLTNQQLPIWLSADSSFISRGITN